jgi:hypothetical protein
VNEPKIVRQHVPDPAEGFVRIGEAATQPVRKKLMERVDFLTATVV